MIRRRTIHHPFEANEKFCSVLTNYETELPCSLDQVIWIHDPARFLFYDTHKHSSSTSLAVLFDVESVDTLLDRLETPRPDCGDTGAFCRTHPARCWCFSMQVLYGCVTCCVAVLEPLLSLKCLE